MDFQSTSAQLVKDLMRDFGLTEFQAAGLVGNLAYESGNFKQLQEKEPLIPGSKGGYGFAQWTGVRRDGFENWIKSQDSQIDPASYSANYGYLKHELSNVLPDSLGSIGVNTISKLKDTNSLEEATSLVSNYYLRPAKETANIDKRQIRSKEIFDNSFKLEKDPVPKLRPDNLEVPVEPTVNTLVPQQTSIPQMRPDNLSIQEQEVPQPQSFGQAFSQARQQHGGDGGIFEWNGNKYTTDIAKEVPAVAEPMFPREEFVPTVPPRVTSTADSRINVPPFEGLEIPEIGFNNGTNSVPGYNEGTGMISAMDSIAKMREQYVKDLLERSNQQRIETDAIDEDLAFAQPVPQANSNDSTFTKPVDGSMRFALNTATALDNRYPTPLTQRQIDTRANRYARSTADGSYGDPQAGYSQEVPVPFAGMFTTPGNDLMYKPENNTQVKNNVNYTEYTTQTMTQQEAESILQDPNASEESKLNARKFVSGNFIVPSEIDNSVMTEEKAYSILQDPNANPLDITKAQQFFGGIKPSEGRGKGEIEVAARKSLTEEINLEDQFPTPGDDLMYEPPELTNNGKNTSSLVSETGLTLKNGVIVNSKGEEVGNPPPPPPEAKNKIEGLLKDYFGLEGKDIVKALGYYLMSRATGASHAGSMRWAGGVVLDSAAKREAKEDKLEAKTASDQGKINTLVKAGYTRASAEAAVKTDMDDLLVKDGTDFSLGQPKGDIKRIQVDNVKGFENQVIHTQTYKNKDGAEVEMVTFTVPSTNKKRTMPLFDFEKLVKSNNGFINTTPDTANTRTDAAKDYANSMESAFKEIISGGKAGANTSMSSSWAAGLAKYFDSQKYDLSNTGVALSLQELSLEAARIATQKQMGGKITVNRIDDIVKTLQLNASTMQANQSVWEIKGSKEGVPAFKIAELQKIMFEEEDGNLAKVSKKFLSFFNDFKVLEKENSEAYAKLKPNKNENKFYVYLYNKLTT